MVKIIDERGEIKNTFGALEIGEWFIDDNGMVCLKVDNDRGLYMNCKEEWSNEEFGSSETVIPIKVEVHIIE
jgi:hypothetical protein